MSSTPFEFKQFSVYQDRCAMKIGTDGVLLGAWVPIDQEVDTILDIGTGTGVIALMLAQRSNAQTIDALEIDADAYEQAVENFEISDWGDRLFCYHASFQEFVAEIDDQYDLLISNPPFYTEDYKTPDSQRNLARFQDALPFEHILAGSVKLLSEKGKLAFIIPYHQEENILRMAREVNLFAEKVTRVQGNPNTDIKRSLLLLGFDQIENITYDTLVIEYNRHDFTEEYRELTRDFYLKL